MDLSTLYSNGFYFVELNTKLQPVLFVSRQKTRFKTSLRWPLRFIKMPDGASMSLVCHCGFHPYSQSLVLQCLCVLASVGHTEPLLILAVLGFCTCVLRRHRNLLATTPKAFSNTLLLIKMLCLNLLSRHSQV